MQEWCVDKFNTVGRTTCLWLLQTVSIFRSSSAWKKMFYFREKNVTVLFFLYDSFYLLYQEKFCFFFKIDSEIISLNLSLFFINYSIITQIVYFIFSLKQISIVVWQQNWSVVDNSLLEQISELSYILFVWKIETGRNTIFF